MNALAALASLRYLNLSYCNGVTDAGLAHLSRFAGVRQLFLRGWRNIVAHGYAAVYQDTRGRYGSEGEDRVYAEVAELFEVPVGTVRSRLSRGRSTLQRALWEQARERGLVGGPGSERER